MPAVYVPYERLPAGNRGGRSPLLAIAAVVARRLEGTAGLVRLVWCGVLGEAVGGRMRVHGAADDEVGGRAGRGDSRGRVGNKCVRSRWKRGGAHDTETSWRSATIICYLT